MTSIRRRKHLLNEAKVLSNSSKHVKAILDKTIKLVIFKSRSKSTSRETDIVRN